ncbi:MAG: hypothetical protein PHR81_05840, partial [Bacteroidales bacterium]|nr:hypothetical protein [Bacteroidales bacterium]
MKKFLSFLSGLLFAATSLIAQTTVFQEDFEPPSNDNNVLPTGTTNFAINTRLFVSGTQCDTAFVGTSGTSYLTTLPFSTVGYTNVLLNFSHICKIEFSDTAKIEVSVDGGVTWTKLKNEYLGIAQFSTQSYRFSANAYPEWLVNTNDAKPQQSWWRNELFDISAIAAGQ